MMTMQLGESSEQAKRPRYCRLALPIETFALLENQGEVLAKLDGGELTNLFLLAKSESKRNMKLVKVLTTKFPWAANHILWPMPGENEVDFALRVCKAHRITHIIDYRKHILKDIILCNDLIYTLVRVPRKDDNWETVNSWLTTTQPKYYPRTNSDTFTIIET